MFSYHNYVLGAQMNHLFETVFELSNKKNNCLEHTLS